VIDTLQDVFILVDFDTKSQWERETSEQILRHATIDLREIPVTFVERPVPTSERLKHVYHKTRDRLFAQLGHKDPHTLPRHLHLVAGKDKLAYISRGPDDLFLSPPSNGWYVGRNNRFKVEAFQTYREKVFSQPPYTVFEFCHNFLEFADFLSLSQQHQFDVLVADLKVEHWYFQRFQKWSQRIQDVYSTIRQYQNCA
jgi:hypothetical protein